MEKLQMFLLALLALSSTLLAQDTSYYSLADILARAHTDALQLSILRSDIEAQRTQAVQYRAEAFPNIQFSSGASYVSQSLRGLGPQSANELTAFFDRIDGYLLSWSLSAQQPLFSFGRIFNSLRLARISDELTNYSSRLQRDMFFLSLIAHFTDTYLAQIDEEIARNAAVRSQRTLQIFARDLEFARISRRDFLRIEALSQNDQARYRAAKSAFAIARRRLVSMAALPDSTFRLRFDGPETALSQTDSSSGNIELHMKEAQIAIYRLQTSLIRAAMLPTVSLTGSAANQFMTIDTTGLTQRYNEFLEQSGGTDPQTGNDQAALQNPEPRRYFDPAFINYTIGLQLTWQIFDANRTLAQLRQAKANRKKAVLEHALQRRNNETDIAEARDQVILFDSLIVAARLQVAFHERILNQTSRDFADRYVNALDYLEAEQEYRAAQRQLAATESQRVLAEARHRIARGLPLYEK